MKVLESEAELTEARLLSIKSIYALNPLWKALPPDLGEANAYLEYMISESNRYKLAWGYYVDGRMVAFLMSFPAR